MFVLVVAVISVLLLITLPLLARLCRFSVARDQNFTAAEAACLAAAQDLSRIVINDPHYGYVSLSDHPPSGRATLARDGEPLPVYGVNTLVATARLDLLIANNIGNEDLKRLALQDAKEAHRAQMALCDKLAKALAANATEDFRDYDGNSIHPFKHARDVYEQNLASMHAADHLKLKDLRLGLGWLQQGGTTTTPVPKPEDLSQTHRGTAALGMYRPFVDVACDCEHFYFCGLGAQPSLVDTKYFSKPDGVRPCSIVKIDADLTVCSTSQSAEHTGTTDITHATACAQPSAAKDITPSGSMALSFPDGLVPNLRTMRDLISDSQLSRHPINVYTAVGGDYPNDSQAELLSDQNHGSVKTVSQVFAQGLYDWLRTAHTKPRVDSLANVIDTQFAKLPDFPSSATITPLLFDVDSKGNVAAGFLKSSPFYSQTVNEGQAYALSFDAIKSGSVRWTLLYRDQVNQLGTDIGGKHAGQAMPGDPVNWCELAQYSGSVDSAKARSKGAEALGMRVTGQPAAGESSGISLSSASFSSTNGTMLAAQPRKSFYSGGLAVEFVVSSPTDDAD